jgi:CDP-6-deoxy-D-xylo-4-hexulose-3-dehydrase
LKLIEDSADTIGYKNIFNQKYKKSDVCTTSFYASHVVTGAGFGGMACFDNFKLFKLARSLRNWGRRSANYGETEDYIRRFNNKIDGIRYDDKYVFDDLGYNFMGSDISAAFALRKLKNLEKNLNKRKKNFYKLKTIFNKYSDIIETFDTTQGYETGWLAFPIMVKGEYRNKRTDLQIKFEKSGIQTRTIFTGNITRHPVAKKFKWSIYGNLANSDKIMQSGILLGCHESIIKEHISYLREKLSEFFE